MIKVLNFHSRPESRVWFTSDWHLGHNRDFVWQARGYSSPTDHTEAIIRTINDQAKSEDIIINLGDYCLNTSQDEFDNYTRRINSTIYYIWGNHNSRIKDAYQNAVLFQYGRSDIEVYPLNYKNIVFVGNYLEASVNGSYLIMSHYPMDIFNKGGHGSFMLCGHSHYGYEKTRENCLDSKRLDVGWDGFKRMLSIEDIQKIMAKKKHVILDHH
jgi:calcineurin-like phosphoesterase family protein